MSLFFNLLLLCSLALLSVQSQDIFQIFEVTLSTKTSQHPHYGQGNATGFSVDGIQGAQLTLERGRLYQFDLNFPCSHHFDLSKNDVAKVQSKDIYDFGVMKNETCNGGSLTLNTTEAPQDEIWYVSLNGESMGGPIKFEGGASPASVLVSSCLLTLLSALVVVLSF